MSQSGSTSGVFTTGAWCGILFWRGEEEDWVQEVPKNPPKKDEVIVALVKLARQPTKHMQCSSTKQKTKVIGAHSS